MIVRKSSDHRALVTADLLVALGLIALLIAPLSIGWLKEQRVLRGLYQRSIAMQIVDGEAEIIAAGNWKSVRPGRHPFTVQAEARRNLPSGQFLITRSPESIRLEWIPGKPGHGGPVARVIPLPPTAAKEGAR